MPNVLVRDVDLSVLEKLKKRAVGKGRSLQSELQILLKEAAEKRELLTELETIRKIRALISNKVQTDSAELLREDRAR